MQSEMGKTRGLLRPTAGKQKFQLARYLPSPDLSFFVQRYWVVRWDLRGDKPYVQENLTYPCVNLVFEQDKTRIYGVESSRSSILLRDLGHVLGIKFRPGAFYPFVKYPVSELTDRTLTLEEVFGVNSQMLEAAILPLADDKAMVNAAENFLREHLPPQDETVTEINRIVEMIITQRDIHKVDDLLPQLDMSKRTLQRLFKQYVGVPPKWVIQQYRLHEAVDQLADHDSPNGSRMAADLGYFDQAHFIKDFKRIVGKTPEQYARTLGFDA
ncbi:MAG: helix-turn-helix domain-containing protein [Anaerolineae bacterium]